MSAAHVRCSKTQAWHDTTQMKFIDVTQKCTIIIPLDGLPCGALYAAHPEVAPSTSSSSAGKSHRNTSARAMHVNMRDVDFLSSLSLSLSSGNCETGCACKITRNQLEEQKENGGYALNLDDLCPAMACQHRVSSHEQRGKARPFVGRVQC